MKSIKDLFILILVMLTFSVTACSKEDKKTSSAAVSPNASATDSKSAVTKNKPVQDSAKQAETPSTPWASLNETQRSVLSIAETVWPTIPPEKQKYFMEGADLWTKTAPEDQKKLLAELNTYIVSP